MLYNSMLGMDMSEEMDFEIMERRESFKDFLRAIVDTVIAIKDPIGWRMGDKNVGIFGDTGIIAALTVSYTVAGKHRNTIEFQSVNLDAGVTQVMHIVIKAVNAGSVQAVVVVAANEYLVARWQIAEPVEKINCFLFAPDHAEIA